MFKRFEPLGMEDYFEERTSKWSDSESNTSAKQQNTTNQLLRFCDLILQYEKYTPIKKEMNNSVYSPASSERTNDSFSSSESNSSFSSSHIDDKSQNLDVDTDDDSYDLITCHCMKPFAGRPMIECTECQTWVHMSCAKIKRKNIPEDFICQNCREARASARRSERIKSDDRRLLSA